MAVLLILYSVVEGLLGKVPSLDILNESIRNLYYHVPMWFAMVILLLIAFISSIVYLTNSNNTADWWAEEFTNTAMVLGLLGLLTGMIWANFTWGKPWTNDPKLNSVAIGMLMYSGYLVLRQAIEDQEKRARVSAVFSVFAFPMFVVLIFILPRLGPSLHPGNGGNPGFNSYDLDHNMRMVFYPAVLGWILFASWIANIRVRIRKLEDHNESLF